MTQEYLRLRPDIVSLQWHEAVAVVQGVARQHLASGDTSLVPAITGLAIDHNGGVHIVDSRSTTGDGPAALGALLRELLQFSSATPPALASLADGAEGTPPRFRSMEEFSEALRFFERPLSQHDLAAHAARLATAQEQHRLNAELEHLTQKARDVDGRPQRPDGGSASRRSSNGRKVAIAVLVVAFLVVAVVAGALAGWKRIGPQSVREVGSRLVERVRTEAKAVLSGTPQPPPPQETVPRTSLPSRPPRRDLEQSVALPAILTMQAIDVLRLSDGERPGDEDPVPESTPASAVPLRRSARGVYVVYSGADPEVKPPVLVRPQLRELPAIYAQADPGAVVDLYVDEFGAVSQVRLGPVSAAQRYHAAMMVSAAKAWRFEPALRDGRPVRYRLRLRIS